MRERNSHRATRERIHDAGKNLRSQNPGSGRGLMARQERERPRLRKPDTRARQSHPPQRFDKYAWVNHVLGYERRLAWLGAK
jgi:hypothetical protein